ncbi:hexose kinase [Clostridiaceae bacterium NSJ-31]|uniref:Tagatose-6-phosphate kinase n=1 Tax=Ligaoa zhengdingensis TaxID=2763658 RepID=A0A926DZ13_9FIRM|nr:hexose kinase [Ligaoa zhengdingensis]MBC8546187.1 hexose kinase [Ligaoa zhengdingensis]
MSFNRIVTVSLNPALDITLWVSGLDREYNDVTNEQWEAAGKAVNVARVMHAYGSPVKAVLLAGEDNRKRYFDRLDREGIDYEAVLLPGETRENISLVQPDGSLLRLARPGFFVEAAHLDELKNRLRRLVGPGTLAVLAGRNPRGVGPEAFVELCAFLSGLEARLAVDTSSVGARELAAIRPWIIKPNLEELEGMTGRSCRTREDLCAALHGLHSGGVERVLLSLGGAGLLYSGADGAVWYAQVPEVPVKSTVGAGDSSLAGFLLAHRAGRPLEECVRIAASFGTAAVMIDGTNPPRRADLEWVYPRVELFPLAHDFGPAAGEGG